jgi:hypothetical protein
MGIGACMVFEFDTVGRDCFGSKKRSKSSLGLAVSLVFHTGFGVRTLFDDWEYFM